MKYPTSTSMFYKNEIKDVNALTDYLINFECIHISMKWNIKLWIRVAIIFPAVLNARYAFAYFISMLNRNENQ